MANALLFFTMLHSSLAAGYKPKINLGFVLLGLLSQSVGDAEKSALIPLYLKKEARCCALVLFSPCAFPGLPGLNSDALAFIPTFVLGLWIKVNPFLLYVCSTCCRYNYVKKGD